MWSTDWVDCFPNIGGKQKLLSFAKPVSFLLHKDEHLHPCVPPAFWLNKFAGISGETAADVLMQNSEEDLVVQTKHVPLVITHCLPQ